MKSSEDIVDVDYLKVSYQTMQMEIQKQRNVCKNIGRYKNLLTH